MRAGSPHYAARRARYSKYLSGTLQSLPLAAQRDSKVRFAVAPQEHRWRRGHVQAIEMQGTQRHIRVLCVLERAEYSTIHGAGKGQTRFWALGANAADRAHARLMSKARERTRQV